jgi:hypothetical protein
MNPLSWKEIQQRMAAAGQYDTGALDSMTFESPDPQVGDRLRYRGPDGDVRNGTITAINPIRVHWDNP